MYKYSIWTNLDFCIQTVSLPGSKGAAKRRTIMAQAHITPRPGRASIADSGLAARLKRELDGEVLFDAFSRGRYSTDASIYQIEPVGVVVPRSDADIARTIEIAAEAQVPVLARGGGTSQCGQTVGHPVRR